MKTDGGSALILLVAERARDFPQAPIYLLGASQSVETRMVAQNRGFHRQSAADALSKIGKAAVSTLAAALKHPDEDVRRIAAVALALIQVRISGVRDRPLEARRSGSSLDFVS